jgi:hypothetical protein
MVTPYFNEVIGWIGAVAFLTAYLMLSLKILSSDKALYHYLNAAGGILMSVSTFNIQDRPAFLVNFIWMTIAIISLVRIYRLGRRKS